jgi:hypothetical protein
MKFGKKHYPSVNAFVERIAARKYKGWSFSGMTSEEYHRKVDEIRDDYWKMSVENFDQKYGIYIY